MLITFLIIIPAFAVICFLFARKKNVDLIILNSIKNVKRNRALKQTDGTRHVFFCFVDHFEPLWNNADEKKALERVHNWLSGYPSRFASYRDRGGHAPQHTFFYPQEEYIPECLDMLAKLKDAGFGDVEIHLHHDRDTSEGLREKIESFKEILHDRHGLLRKNEKTGKIEYGFIHGNWALDDSGPGGRYCGVKDEITILKETGCYADFTFPSAPHPTQPPVINRIYYATDDPCRSKSHFHGRQAAFDSPPSGDLLMITGTLAVNWRIRRRGIFPAIENSDITAINPPLSSRIDLWIKENISVKNWPGWIFVKVHTHGAQEENSGLILGGGANAMHDHLLGNYNDGKQYVIHYVTAWELYKCIKLLENGDRRGMSLVENFDYPF